MVMTAVVVIAAAIIITTAVAIIKNATLCIIKKDAGLQTIPSRNVGRHTSSIS
jgi:hypothetical protein